MQFFPRKTERNNRPTRHVLLHATRAQLPWHVQKCDMYGFLDMWLGNESLRACIWVCCAVFCYGCIISFQWIRVFAIFVVITSWNGPSYNLPYCQRSILLRSRKKWFVNNHTKRKQNANWMHYSVFHPIIYRLCAEFDTPDHTALMIKLSKHGMKETPRKWFDIDRFDITHLHKEIECLKGSTLYSLLFWINMNNRQTRFYSVCRCYDFIWSDGSFHSVEI